MFFFFFFFSKKRVAGPVACSFALTHVECILQAARHSDVIPYPSSGPHMILAITSPSLKKLFIQMES